MSRLPSEPNIAARDKEATFVTRLLLGFVASLVLALGSGSALADPDQESSSQSDDGVCIPVFNFNHNTSQRLAAEFGFGCGGDEHRLPYFSYETGEGGDKVHFGVMGPPEHTDMPLIMSVSFVRLRTHDGYLSYRRRRYYSGIEIKASALVMLFKVGLLLEESSRRPMLVAGIGVGI